MHEKMPTTCWHCAHQQTSLISWLKKVLLAMQQAYKQCLQYRANNHVNNQPYGEENQAFIGILTTGPLRQSSTQVLGRQWWVKGHIKDLTLIFLQCWLLSRLLAASYTFSSWQLCSFSTVCERFSDNYCNTQEGTTGTYKHNNSAPYHRNCVCYCWTNVAQYGPTYVVLANNPLPPALCHYVTVWLLLVWSTTKG